MEGHLVLLPLEVWTLIWAQVGLLHKARLELCSSAFRALIWHHSPILQFKKQVEPLERVLQVLATKPAAGRALERFKHNCNFPSSSAYLQAFTNTTALTHINVCEPARGGTFLALVAARCPLKNVAIRSEAKDLYTSIEGKHLAVLAPTLRRLALFATPSVPEASPAFLTAIATELGPTLVTLAISTSNWAPLKPMALKELFIHPGRTFTPDASFPVGEGFDAAVAALLASTPLGVGVNLVQIIDSHPTSFLIRAMKTAPERVKVLLDKYCADPNLAPFDRTLVTQRKPILFTAINESHYEVAKALIEKGATVYYPQARYSSVFSTMLFRRTDDRDWLPFAEYLFDEFWPKAIAQWTPVELLGFPPSEVLFRLLPGTASRAFARRSNFVLRRPQIFGVHSTDNLDPKGCNLAHHCTSYDTEVIAQLKIDWRVRDNAGYDALECHAANKSYGTRRLIGLWCQADADFVAHCTPLIWGVIGSEVGHISGESDSLFVGLANRMLRLCPEESWEELIAASLQIRLRYSTSNTLSGWLALGGDKLQALVRKALFRPWREVKASPWFGRYSLDPDALGPLPQVGSLEPQLPAIGKLAKEYFKTEAEARAWIDERNDQGLSAKEHFESRLSGGELASRLKCLEFLWPVDKQ